LHGGYFVGGIKTTTNQKKKHMNASTGQLMAPAEYQTLKETQPEEAKKYVEVKRDLTQLETANMQIKLYAPCVCGSGKKFKFCCHKPATA
jgi:uncharacterized protein YchJ